MQATGYGVPESDLPAARWGQVRLARDRADGEPDGTTARSAVEIPPLFCPIPAAPHHETAAIERRVVDWMAQFGFCDDDFHHAQVIANRTAEWACRIAPGGTADPLQIGADWSCLGLLLDDVYLDGGLYSRHPERFLPMAVRVIHGADHPETTDDETADPYTAAFGEVSHRYRSYASGTVVRRWIDGVAEWFLAASVGLAQRASGTVPSLAEYLVIGPRDRGTKASIAVIEMAEGTSLPNEAAETPRIRALTQIASALVTFANDVYSYHREVKEQSLESNLVGVLEHELRVPPQEAMARAAALHDRLMCLYVTLRDRTAYRAAPETRCYLGQLDHFIRGNLDYSAVTPRYRTDPSAVPDPAPAFGVWADSPCDGSLEPLPLRPVAWWWDQLSPAV
ncbi:terpene synthase family protein [Streptomyces sp. NPDC017529]|uniref:terpene synthase family protein n=1 Tax=Streptomyces sp. NPDC017529 TaxID=3365000 RepID=UPI0037B6FFE8